jgi:predicted O-linked N-acetylglucosamine transferase (SPINDLY family)
MDEIERAKELFFAALDLMDSEDNQGAELRLRRAQKLAPRSVPVLTNLSIALFRQKKFADARECAQQAILIDPQHIEAYNIVANCFAEEANFSDALIYCDKIISMGPESPDLAEVYSNRGNALSRLHRYEEAIVSCNRAITLNPNHAQAYTNLGFALNDVNRHKEALDNFEKAIAIDSSQAGAWAGRGNIYSEAKRFEDAFAAYDMAYTIKPDLKYGEGDRLFAKMQICDWSNLDRDFQHVISAVKGGAHAIQPFSFLGAPSSPGDQFECAKLFAADSYPPSSAPLWRDEIYTHDRIRIAYVTSDLHDHATAHLIAGLFEQHDKSRFEIAAVSFGPDQDSKIRHRIRKSFDRFIDARLMSDDEIANKIREMEIDIAVDLKGFTQNSRSNIFAKRPAPIQVNYLGYPGTMGADYIDYIIGDRFVIPENHRRFYSEKVVYLPESYQANDTERKIANTSPGRIESKLPQVGFVFCSFNNSYKILPEMFDIWMRLLREIEGSVLWLLEGGPAVSINLRREAERRGVAGDRLVFAPRAELSDHLARHRLADLFLDTLPINAHTTASDSLWAGLPVLTCLGSTFAGRVAGSLLSAVGIDELITQSLDDYEALALRLARNPDELALLKADLARRRLSHPLFNARRFARHIESAYTTMWQRYQRRESPAHFAVGVWGGNEDAVGV